MSWHNDLSSLRSRAFRQASLRSAKLFSRCAQFLSGLSRPPRQFLASLLFLISVALGLVIPVPSPWQGSPFENKPTGQTKPPLPARAHRHATPRGPVPARVGLPGADRSIVAARQPELPAARRHPKPAATTLPALQGSVSLRPRDGAADAPGRSGKREKGFEIRAIYLTGYTAGSARGREMIRRWREAGGNAVVFDIKDYDGWLSVPFRHERAPRQRYFPIRDLAEFVRFLRDLQLHSIARIALFRDEQFVQQFPDLAVRSRRTGQPWQENGKLGWTDPSRPEVQAYNLALAKYVAESGVDEIQFDYVRFPAEGDQKDADFFFRSNRPEWKRSDVISDFLAQSYEELRSLGVLVSLDVFGVMAWEHPVDLRHTGQDIRAMAQFCDILSPMIYPSHFFGMNGYKRPGDSPEYFVRASMTRFRELTSGTGVVIRPWLQAFGWRTRTYSPGYIRTQVDVAKDSGGIGFLFWNARNDYSNVFLAFTERHATPGQSPQDHAMKVGHIEAPIIPGRATAPPSGGFPTFGPAFPSLQSFQPW